jgi:hypothetical protein
LEQLRFKGIVSQPCEGRSKEYTKSKSSIVSTTGIPLSPFAEQGIIVEKLLQAVLLEADFGLYLRYAAHNGGVSIRKLSTGMARTGQSSLRIRMVKQSGAGLAHLGFFVHNDGLPF